MIPLLAIASLTVGISLIVYTIYTSRPSPLIQLGEHDGFETQVLFGRQSNFQDLADEDFVPESQLDEYFEKDTDAAAKSLFMRTVRRLADGAEERYPRDFALILHYLATNGPNGQIESDDLINMLLRIVGDAVKMETYLKLERIEQQLAYANTPAGLYRSKFTPDFEIQSEMTDVGEVSVYSTDTITPDITPVRTNDWEASKLVGRRIQLNTVEFKDQQAGESLFNLPIPKSLEDSRQASRVSQMMRFFSMFNAKVKFIVVASARAMTGGVIAISYDPYGRLTTTTSSFGRHHALTADHVIMDLSSETESVLSVSLDHIAPFLSADYGNTMPTTFGNFVCTPLSTAKKVDGTAGIQLTSYIEFTDIQLAGLIEPDTSRTYITPQSDVTPHVYDNGGNLAANKQSFVLSAFENYMISGHVGTRAVDYAKRPGFSGIATWKPEHTVGTSLGQFTVHPCVSSVETEATQIKIKTTPVGMVTSMFSYWRGSLIYTCHLAATQTHTGTLAVVFAPGNRTIDITNYADYPFVLWNIAEAHTLEFPVHYQSPTTWKATTKKGVFRDVNDVKMGTLQFVIVSPLVSAIYTTTPLELIVLSRAGPDFQVSEPGNHYESELSFETQMNETLSYAAPRMHATDVTLEQVVQRFSPLDTGIELSGENVLVVPVRPYTPSGKTPRDTVSSMFAYGSGSLKYRIAVKATTQHRRLVTMAYVPNMVLDYARLNKVSSHEVRALINRVQTINKVTVDVAVNTVATILIPYRSEFDQQYLPHRFNDKSTTPYPALSTNTGCLMIYSHSEDQDLEFDLSLALGEDYVFSTPTSYPPYIFKRHAEQLTLSPDQQEEREVEQALDIRPGQSGFYTPRFQVQSDFHEESAKLTWRNAYGLKTTLQNVHDITSTLSKDLKQGTQTVLEKSMENIGSRLGSKFFAGVRTYASSEAFWFKAILSVAAISLFVIVNLLGPHHSKNVFNVLFGVVVIYFIGDFGIKIRDACSNALDQFTVQNGLGSYIPEIVTVIISIVLTLIGVKSSKSYLTALDSVAVQGRNINFLKMGWETLTKLHETLTAKIAPEVGEDVKNIFSRFIHGDKKVWTDALDLLDPARRLEILRSTTLRDDVLRVYTTLKSLHEETAQVDVDPRAVLTLRNIFTRFEQLRAEVLDFHTTAEFRIDPFHISFFGRPKIGKSKIMTDTMKDVFAIMDWPRDNMSYTVNPAVKHYDNYLGQRCIIFDDLGAINGPDVAESDLGKMMSMKSNQRLKLPMAKLDQKGREFESHLIISATNVAVYQRNGFADLSALNRRRDLLVQVDRATTEQEIGTETIAFTGRYGNSVVRYRVLNSLTGLPESEWMTYVQFLQIMRPRVEEHFAYQHQVLAEAQDTTATAAFAEAFQVQSDEMGRGNEALKEHYLTLGKNDFARIPITTIVEALDYREEAEYNLVMKGRKSKADITNPIVKKLADSFANRHRMQLAQEHERATLARLNNHWLYNNPLSLGVALLFIITSMYLFYKWFIASDSPIVEFDQESEYKSQGRPIVTHESGVTEVRDRVHRIRKTVAESGVTDVKDRISHRRRQMVVEGEAPVPESGVADIKDRVRAVKRNVVVEGDYSKIPFLDKIEPEYFDPAVAEARINKYAEEAISQTTDVTVYYGLDVQSMINKQVGAIATSALDNLADIRFSRGGQASRIRGFLLQDTQLVLPRHFFEFAQIKEDEIFSVAIRGKEYRQSFTKARYLVHESADLCMYQLTTRVSGAKSILRHIASARDHGSFVSSTGSLLAISATGGTPYVDRYALTKVQQNTEVTYRAGEYVNRLRGYSYRANTVKGDCGALLFSDATLSGPILGFHVGALALQNTGFSERLVRETLATMSDLLNKQTNTIVIQSTMDHVAEMIDAGFITQEKPRGMSVYDLVHTIPIIGTIAQAFSRRNPDTSKMRYTSIDSVLGSRTQEPAVLGDRDPRNSNNKSVIAKQVSGYGQDVLPFSERNYTMIEQHITAKYRNWAGGYRRNDGKLAVLTLDEAINGVPGQSHIRGMNMSTSEGIIWQAGRGISEHSKKWLFTQETRPTGEIYYVASPELQARVAHCLDNLERGQRFELIIAETLKDERRGIKHTRNLKNDPTFVPKTRSFSICPVEYTILVRMFCSSFIGQMEDNRENIEPQIGIDPCSAEWTNLYRQMKEVSPYVVAGDFGNYDRGNPAENLDCAGKIINNVYDDGKINQTIRYTLMTMAYNHLSLIDNLIIIIEQGLPSGYPLTSPTNCIDNDIYKYHTWLLVAPPEKRTLVACDQLTRSKYYGDDHLHAIAEEALPYYNMRTIGATFEKHGITYTDENKNHWSLAPPFIKIEDAEFMKRGFVPDPRTGYVRAPLAKDTIENRYRMYMDSPHVTHDEILTELIQNSLRDAFMHGQEYFEHIERTTRDALKKVDQLELMPAMSYESEVYNWDLKCNGDIDSRYSYPSGQAYGA
jgi:hypothetical protein